MLICRKGEEGAALAFPLTGDDSKNMGLDASWEARVRRGVWEAAGAAGAGLLRAWELRVDRLAGEDIVSRVESHFVYSE